MINFFSRIRRLRMKIALLRQGAMNAYGSKKKSILPRRSLRKSNKTSISQAETERVALRHISRSLPKPVAQSDQTAVTDAAEKSDVAAFRSELELMLASMSAALAHSHSRIDSDGNHVSNLDSALENDVADAVRQLSMRALGV